MFVKHRVTENNTPTKKYESRFYEVITTWRHGGALDPQELGEFERLQNVVLQFQCVLPLKG